MKEIAKLIPLDAQSDSHRSQTDKSKAPSPLRSAGALQSSVSRRKFLSTAVAAPAVLGILRNVKAAGEVISFKSPNSKLQFVLVTTGAQLQYRITRADRSIVELSRLAFLLNGIDLCRDSTISKIERYRISEKYSTRGIHSAAVNNCVGARIWITHPPSKTDYVMEVRAFNDGVGFRWVISGSGSRVPDEATFFKFPTGCTVWFHDFEGHYEGVHQKKTIEDVSHGEWVAPPLTIRLPGGKGYAAVSEAALIGYPGMGLRADGQRGFTTVLGHA
ncbi:MAG TPA: glycoside hydrolase family 97 N-terminal domain-containing protein, partial [Pyrinomonadaceae bacterium]|nr:glycoside hydrolase family 97 N-terminal domain-containing protein [Pyrinomonadaceae bacterium]